MWCIVRVPDVAKRIVFIIEADRGISLRSVFVAVQRISRRD